MVLGNLTLSSMACNHTQQMSRVCQVCLLNCFFSTYGNFQRSMVFKTFRIVFCNFWVFEWKIRTELSSKSVFGNETKLCAMSVIFEVQLQWKVGSFSWQWKYKLKLKVFACAKAIQQNNLQKDFSMAFKVGSYEMKRESLKFFRGAKVCHWNFLSAWMFFWIKMMVTSTWEPTIRAWTGRFERTRMKRFWK